jgi:hypothetical protein
MMCKSPGGEPGLGQNLKIATAGADRVRPNADAAQTDAAGGHGDHRRGASVVQLL